MKIKKKKKKNKMEKNEIYLYYSLVIYFFEKNKNILSNMCK